ncbi:zinc finger protein weckle-like isoform X2 [Toxorhynchites rutilus septentrionalis]|nr:zinc finger protein weckle-like isoform X2 [Toxorhynchites rutilus septentrionalis]
MLSNWRNWCRLCANECAVFKLESLEELNEITLRHFHFSLQHLNEVCNCICEECYGFVNKLDRFKERCMQTSKMLLELCATSDDELLDSDIQDLRFRFLSDSLFAAAGSEDNQDKKYVAPVLDPLIEQEMDTNDLVGLKIERVQQIETKGRLNDHGEDSQDEHLVSEPLIEIDYGSDNRVADIVEEEFDQFHDPKLIHFTQDVQQSDDDYNGDHDTVSDGDIKEEQGEDCSYSRSKRKDRKKSFAKTPNAKTNDPIKYTTCELCSKTFRSQPVYIQHLQSQHPEFEQLTYPCSKCPKRFLSKKNAKLHESVHLPDDQKFIHPCGYCDKKFSKLVNVQAHIKAVHIGERPFICEECGKACASSGALRDHKKVHSNETPFQCSHCPKKFKNLPTLRTHEDIHNDTLYVCSHCGLQLNTKRTLKMHMVVHSDQKKFKCQYCGNEYKRSKALKTHLILHTGLRPYQCPFCEKTFANGSNCRSHKKKAHPKELAALEASGGQTHATNIPKLEQLQPK